MGLLDTYIAIRKAAKEEMDQNRSNNPKKEVKSNAQRINNYEIEFYCTNCGTKVNNTINFCPNCGSKIIIRTEAERKIREKMKKEAKEEHEKEEHQKKLNDIYHRMIKGTKIRVLTKEAITKTVTRREPAWTDTVHGRFGSSSTHYPAYDYTATETISPAEYKLCTVYFDQEKMTLTSPEYFKEIFYDEVVDLQFENQVMHVYLKLKNNEKIKLLIIHHESFTLKNEKNMICEAFIKTFKEQGNNLPEEYLNS